MPTRGSNAGTRSARRTLPRSTRRWVDRGLQHRLRLGNNDAVGAARACRPRCHGGGGHMVTVGMPSRRTGFTLLAVSALIFMSGSSCGPTSPGIADSTLPEFLDARAVFTSSDGAIREWSLMPDNDGNTNNDDILVSSF